MDAMDVDSPAQSMLCNGFHRFNDLPTELRLKIWELNLPSPRVVKIWYHKSPDHSLPPRLVSSAKVPVNLHVNREARAEALRTYPLQFGFHGRTGSIPFDSSLDVLFFVPSLPPPGGVCSSDLFAEIKTSLMFIPDAELALIRRLAIDAAPTLIPNGRPSPMQDPHQLCQTRRTLEVLEDIRRYLPNLREFHLVTPPTSFHHPGLKLSMEEWTKRAIAILAEETEDWETPICSVGSIESLLSPAATPITGIRCFQMAVPQNYPSFDLVRDSLRDLLRQIRPNRLQCGGPVQVEAGGGGGNEVLCKSIS